MNLFLVVDFFFLGCLLVQRSSCLNCYASKNWKWNKNWKSEWETAIGFDESKVEQVKCPAGTVCYLQDKYTTDGKLGEFN